MATYQTKYSSQHKRLVSNRSPAKSHIPHPESHGSYPPRSMGHPYIRDVSLWRGSGGMKSLAETLDKAERKDMSENKADMEEKNSKGRIMPAASWIAHIAAEGIVNFNAFALI